MDVYSLKINNIYVEILSQVHKESVQNRLILGYFKLHNKLFDIRTTLVDKLISYILTKKYICL